MQTRHLRAGWRALVKEPAYSVVVVAGLAIGVAACLLLLGLVRYSWGYDADVPDVRQVYVVKQRFNSAPAAPWYDQAPLLLRAAAAQLAGVTAATSYLPSRPQAQSDGKLVARIGERLQQLQSLTVMPGFAEMLGLQALRGDLKATLDRPDSIAITEAAALRLFGSADALGRTLQIEGKLLRAGAIVRTPAAASTIPFEALVGVGSVLVDQESRQQMLTGEQGWSGKVLVRVRPGASLGAIPKRCSWRWTARPASRSSNRRSGRGWANARQWISPCRRCARPISTMRSRAISSRRRANAPIRRWSPASARWVS